MTCTSTTLLTLRVFSLILLILGIISRCYSQSCRNEGAEVQNRCGEICFCIRGRMRECCRIRKDFTSMTLAERRRYVRTLRRVRHRYRRQYRNLIGMHRILFPTGIHQKDQFLPWHRWYLLRFENLLRRVEPCVTIPYWDWSLYSMRPWRQERNSIWFNGPAGLGGNGAGIEGCIPNGPFRGLRTSDGRQCVSRRFNGLPPDIIAVYLNLLHNATTRGFDTFELNLRVNLHDTVHCRVGGTMCNVRSASAPEFFLHHCFIDKIWANWQEYSTDHMEAHFSNITRPMRGSRYGPNRFIDTIEMPDVRRGRLRRRGTTCVLYDDPTHRVYNVVMERLESMTLEQIRQVPRHSFSALNMRQFRFFNINRQERRQARRNLRQELEPVNPIVGNAGLTNRLERNLGFPMNALRAATKKRRAQRTKDNSMYDRWRLKAQRLATEAAHLGATERHVGNYSRNDSY